MLDERWIRSLHVEAMREEELHEEREHHVLFQASTIGALLDGAYDGDLSFAELAEHGDRARPRSILRGSVGAHLKPEQTRSSCWHSGRCTGINLPRRLRVLGFRFPGYAEGIEVSGYHLHFISEDRSRGGHVLASRSNGLRARFDPSSELHVELPPGIDLADPDLAAATHAAIDSVER